MDRTQRPLALLIDDLADYLSQSGMDPAAIHRVRHKDVFMAALDRHIPTSRINGRWYYFAEDVPEIAKALEMVSAVHLTEQAP
jgi:hypothetical protein